VGINMPCKTTVFSGYSVFLNAMNYRQMSGRAGRRGFDLIGNVIFYCVPQFKLNQLLTSKLSDLRGSLPLTISLVLRFMCRYSMWDERVGDANSEKGNKEETMNVIKSIIQTSFSSCNNPHISSMLPFYFYYSMGYLVKEQYIGVDGTPGNFCGLLNHLYFLEPTNFVFVSLLKEGLFDQMLQPSQNKYLTLELLVVLSHLFCIVKFPPMIKVTSANKGPSSVILPPLPENFQKAIKKHNKQALETAILYLKAYARAYKQQLGEDNVLPVSHVVFPSEATNANSPNLIGELKARSEKFSLRSAFSATSGLGDSFDNADELSTSIRQGIYFDRALIPVLELQKGPVNAYIYDLFNHKSAKSILRYNHMRGDILYDNLKHFMLIIKTIAVALEKRNETTSPTVREFKNLATEYTEIFGEYASKF